MFKKDKFKANQSKCTCGLTKRNLIIGSQSIELYDYYKTSKNMNIVIKRNDERINKE